MKDNTNELRKNTLIIAIASMGSKMITFILGPIYSYLLSTEEYGKMDLIVTTASLLLPFICFDIYEAAFRYSCDKKYDKKKIFSTSICFSFLGMVILAVISACVILFFSNIISLWLCVAISSYLDALITILIQFARGIGEMRVYAFSGVVNAIILLASNALLMVMLKYGLNGWIVSFIVAKIGVLIYTVHAIRAFSFFSFKAFDMDYAKEFLKFCIPLLPTATMWWIMNVSDRYVLALYIGPTATGLYAVANKLPNVLSSFENVFYQAWQTTAIKTLSNDDKDEYYSSILRGYIIVVIMAIICILLVVKPFIYYLFAEDYRSSWLCIPILLVAVLIHAINGNLGSLYSVFKQTKGAFYSTLLGAIVNIVLNLIIVRKYALIGAALTTLIGYLCTMIWRAIDTHHFVKLNVLKTNIFIAIAILITQFILTYFDSMWSYIVRTLLIAVFLFINKDLFIDIIKVKK